MNYEAVIGLEVHAQMLTETKIFCGCSTGFGAEPNTQTCPVCAGMPGVLPVFNRKALEFAVKTGLAINCTIAHYSRFARKNYFYPDLPKGYQISQYELPICEHGHVDITVDGKHKRIGITRIHMEDDAGKNIHDPGSGYSLVDLNRTGVPLMEIVSEPDMRSPEEASAYMKKLRTMLRSLGVCDGNMEQGSLRCDANVSVREKGTDTLGTKVELKNMNSFRFVERALEYEIRRQVKTLEEGGSIVQETRLWDTTAGVTVAMRSKEEAHDYRYFPDPDLVPMVVEEKWIEEIRAGMPELPDARMKRFIDEYSLPEYDAEFLTSERALADWYEEAVKLAVEQGIQPKTVSNWVMGSVMKHLNADNITIEEYPISPSYLVSRIIIGEKEDNRSKAKKLFDEAYERGKRGDTTAILDGSVPSITAKLEAEAEERGEKQITDEGAIQETVDEVIGKNPGEFERLCAGEEKLMGFFVGQVMKLTKGKANPKIVNEAVRKRVKGA